MLCIFYSYRIQTWQSFARSDRICNSMVFWRCW